MSCEVWTTKETYICSEALRSKSELQEKIKECEDIIKDCKARITRLAYMTEPKKFYKEEDDVMWQIDRDLEEIFEEYDEARIKLTRLWQFETSWNETHDAQDRAILPVDPRVLKKMSDVVYMGGDYCEYVLEDGSDLPEDWWDVYNGWVKPEDCTFREKLGYEPYIAEPEIDLSPEEFKALLSGEIEKHGITVDLNKL